MMCLQAQQATPPLQPEAAAEQQERPAEEGNFRRDSLAQRGSHITVSLKPGAVQNVYANMEGNVLVHLTAPVLGLSSAQWAVVSWGQSQLTRESLYDAKYIYRCACSSSGSCSLAAGFPH
jgi:hypothetical protein